MHHVVIESPAQFDAKVKKWLRDAHSFSQTYGGRMNT